MKIIIIEGTDNTGKDSLISRILEEYPTATLIHCSKPYSKNNNLAAIEQDTLFQTYINAINSGVYSGTHVLILNRSWIGEYVYGVIYRGRNSDEVKRNILNYEKQLINQEVYYIQLLSTSSELLNKNEDNKSLSNGNITLIAEEVQRFEDIFEASSIKNKKLIYVNDGDKFRSKESIQSEVLKFINR